MEEIAAKTIAQDSANAVRALTALKTVSEGASWYVIIATALCALIAVYVLYNMFTGWASLRALYSCVSSKNVLTGKIGRCFYSKDGATCASSDLGYVYGWCDDKDGQGVRPGTRYGPYDGSCERWIWNAKRCPPDNCSKTDGSANGWGWCIDTETPMEGSSCGPSRGECKGWVWKGSQCCSMRSKLKGCQGDSCICDGEEVPTSATVSQESATASKESATAPTPSPSTASATAPTPSPSTASATAPTSSPSTASAPAPTPSTASATAPTPSPSTASAPSAIPADAWKPYETNKFYLTTEERSLRLEGPPRKDRLVFRGPNSTLSRREFKLQKAPEGSGIYSLIDSDGCKISTRANPQNEEADVAYYPYKYIAEFDGVPSSKSCQEYCGRKEGCQYYLYSKISKKCWLKDSKGTRMPNKGYGFVFGPRTDLPPEPVFTCDEKASSLPMELNGTPDNFAVRVKVPGSSKSCMLQVGDVGEMYIDCEPESALNLPSTFTMEPV